MPQRVSRSDFEEWKGDYITEQLFNFFKLEAELHRRACLELDTSKSFLDLGEEYYKRNYAAQCYDMLQTIEYEDLFPQDESNEGSQES